MLLTLVWGLDLQLETTSFISWYTEPHAVSSTYWALSERSLKSQAITCQSIPGRGQNQPESSVVRIASFHNLPNLLLPPGAHTRNPSPQPLPGSLCLWDRGHLYSEGGPELPSSSWAARFPPENLWNLPPLIYGFGMSSFWFQSC